MSWNVEIVSDTETSQGNISPIENICYSFLGLSFDRGAPCLRRCTDATLLSHVQLNTIHQYYRSLSFISSPLLHNRLSGPTANLSHVFVTVSFLLHMYKSSVQFGNISQFPANISLFSLLHISLFRFVSKSVHEHSELMLLLSWPPFRVVSTWPPVLGSEHVFVDSVIQGRRDQM